MSASVRNTPGGRVPLSFDYVIAAELPSNPEAESFSSDPLKAQEVRGNGEAENGDEKQMDVSNV
jgi:hypothetical protein